MFNFPYTNLHELNLDWILEKVKHFAELIPPMETAVEDVQGLQTDVEQAMEDASQALQDAQSAIETAEEAKEIAEQAASGTIADGAVTTAKLADGAVTSAKIADGSISGNDIAPGTIQTGNLSQGCVTTVQILDGTITSDDLGTECVITDKLADGAVTSDKIENGTILAEDIHNGAVTNPKLADESVSLVKLNNDVKNFYKLQELYFTDTASDYCRVTRTGNNYDVIYVRKTEVANASDVFTLSSDFAPTIDMASLTFYPQASGNALCVGILRPSGIINLSSTLYNERLAGCYHWTFSK